MTVPHHCLNTDIMEQVTRGASFNTEGSRMFTSNPSEDSPVSTFGIENRDDRFDSLNKENSDLFKQFSGDRIWCPASDVEFTVSFFEAGTLKPAVTSAFGVVALDVDIAGKSYVELVDQEGIVIATVDFPVPKSRRSKKSDQGFSFVGIACPRAIIAEAEVELGNVLLEDDENMIDRDTDKVCIDDVFFGEPAPIDH